MKANGTGTIQERRSALLGKSYPYLAAFSLGAGLSAIVGLDLLPAVATFILLNIPGWATRRSERTKLSAAAALVVPAASLGILLLFLAQLAPQVRLPGPDTLLVPYTEAPKLVVGLLLVLSLLSFNHQARRRAWKESPTEKE